jgi:hypothetical protein
MTKLQKQVRAVFPTLPDGIRNIITSENFNDRIEEVGEKYKLDALQKGILVQTTVQLLIGAIHPNEFIETISAEIDIDKSQAALIAKDINHSIFNEVKDALMIVHPNVHHPLVSRMSGLVRVAEPKQEKIPEEAPAKTPDVLPPPPPQISPAIKNMFVQQLGENAFAPKISDTSAGSGSSKGEGGAQKKFDPYREAI